MTTTRFHILPGVTLHWGSKDGGPESRVYMYGLECKALASCLVLRFEDGSREAYHSHSFNAISWILNGGRLCEHMLRPGNMHRVHSRKGGSIFTARTHLHKVRSIGTTWVLSLRGPWAATWTDVDERTGVATRLRAGRVAV